MFLLCACLLMSDKLFVYDDLSFTTTRQDLVDRKALESKPDQFTLEVKDGYATVTIKDNRATEVMFQFEKGKFDRLLTDLKEKLGDSALDETKGGERHLHWFDDQDRHYYLRTKDAKCWLILKRD
jgi:hypothetical protein